MSKFKAHLNGLFENVFLNLESKYFFDAKKCLIIILVEEVLLFLSLDIQMKNQKFFVSKNQSI